MTNFPLLADRISLVVASPYAPGSGQLAVAAVPPFTLAGGQSVRLTITSGVAPAEQFLTHLTATGLSGQVFTGVAAADGYADVEVQPGSFASVRCSAELLNSMTAAINALEEGTAALAPLASPALTGEPTAPTAAAGTSTAQLATTAFVAAAVAASSSPVTSVAGRTGAVTLTAADVGGLGSAATYAASAFMAAGADVEQSQVVGLADALAALAPLASPALTGEPTAPTASPGTSTAQLATTAFVAAAVAAYSPPVTSVFGRTGAVVLDATDMPASGVSAGTYTLATIDVDIYGRVTGAANGPTLGAAATKGVAGTGGSLAAFDGGSAPTSGHLAVWDSAGGLVDGGAVPSGGGGGGMAVGSAVSGATAGTVLYADASGNLGSSANLAWSPSARTLTATTTGSAVPAIVATDGSAAISLVPSAANGAAQVVGSDGAFQVGCNQDYPVTIFSGGTGGSSSVHILSPGGVGVGAAGYGQAFYSEVATSGTQGYIGYLYQITEGGIGGSGPISNVAWQLNNTTLYSLDRYCRPTSGGPAPTTAPGAAAGTGATSAVVGNDVAGMVTLTVGTSPSAGALVGLTFAHARAAAATAPLLTPANSAAAALGAAAYCDVSTNAATGQTISTVTAPAASTTYKWWYRIEG